MFKCKQKKTGCKTPEYNHLTPAPNPNYTPPATVAKSTPPNTGSSVQKPCRHRTPCGWCDKWSKKCDRKIGCNKNVSFNTKCDHEWEWMGNHGGGVYFTCKKCNENRIYPIDNFTTTNKICESDSDHQWECCGVSTAGTTYMCKICGKIKHEPSKYDCGIVLTAL